MSRVELSVRFEVLMAVLLIVQVVGCDAVSLGEWLVTFEVMWCLHLEG